MTLKTRITSVALFLVIFSFSLNSLACEAFAPKGKLIRQSRSEWFSDMENKAVNLAVVFRGYDNDGDGLGDYETSTRIFRDKGEEKFPFQYLFGKDVVSVDPNAKPGDGPVYVFIAEKEYTDLGATGVCENIILTEFDKN